MSISESLLIATFCMVIVFAVLISLFAIIRVFSLILYVFSNKKQPVPVLLQEEITLEQDEEVFSSGTLKLKNVDEPTAAMIMAIVSDESGIPLSELCFKSIRLVEKQL
ncbi:MAG: hypothetical protein K0R07_1667 [Sedimentibacter sp.]|jgi:hypothetical protein|nr:hypothetical protein [Sedimentibacter sp.]